MSDEDKKYIKGVQGNSKDNLEYYKSNPKFKTISKQKSEKLEEYFNLIFIVMTTWLFSSLLLVEELSNSKISYVLIIVMLVLNVASNLLLSKNRISTNMYKDVIIEILFIFSAIITFIFTDQSINLIFIAIAIVLLNQVHVHRKHNISTEKILFLVYTTLTIFLIVYILIPLSLGDIHFRAIRFKGSFSNTNSFGLFLTSLFGVNFYIIIKKICQNSLFKFFSIFTLLLTLVLIIMSSSRNAFLVITIFTIWLLYIEMKFPLKRIIFIIVSIAATLLFLSILGVNIGVISKTIEKLQAGKIFDGRFDMIITSVKDVSLFGHGNAYYLDKEIGAHNSFIHIWNLFGVVGFSLYILMIINRYFSIKNLDSRKITQSFLLVFIIFSLNETVYFSLLYYLFILFSEPHNDLIGLKECVK